jgi:F-box domain
MPHKPTMTITNLPTDVLRCIVQHLQQDAWQRDRPLDDIAALRSVCRSLCRAVDLTATHAKFHANIDVEELRSVTRRCTGGWSCIKQPVYPNVKQ